MSDNPTKDFQRVQRAARSGDKDAALFIAKLADVAAAVDVAALPGSEQGRLEAERRFGKAKA
jgi:hypothetical protein